jgi:hypothetical protein
MRPIESSKKEHFVVCVGCGQAILSSTVAPWWRYLGNYHPTTNIQRPTFSDNALGRWAFDVEH